MGQVVKKKKMDEEKTTAGKLFIDKLYNIWKNRKLGKLIDNQVMITTQMVKSGCGLDQLQEIGSDQAAIIKKCLGIKICCNWITPTLK